MSDAGLPREPPPYERVSTGSTAILIADGRQAWADVMRLRFEKLGWHVVRRADLFGLSLLIQSLRPAVLLVDLSMVDEVWARRVDALVALAPDVGILVVDPDAFSEAVAADLIAQVLAGRA